MASDAGAFGLSGQGKGSAGKFELSVDLKQLAALDAGLAGAASATSTIELRPDGTASGSLALKGDVQGRPVSLAGRFDRDAAGGIVVPSVEGHWASAALNVTDLAITPDRTSGSARLTVERLQDVSALLGMELAGSIDAEVTTDPQLASGRLQARISGTGLQSGAIRIAKLQVDGTIDDPMGKVATDARITASWAERRRRSRADQRHGERRPAKRPRRRAAGLGRQQPMPRSPPRSSFWPTKFASRFSVSKAAIRESRWH